MQSGEVSVYLWVNTLYFFMGLGAWSGWPGISVLRCLGVGMKFVVEGKGTPKIDSTIGTTCSHDAEDQGAGI